MDNREIFAVTGGSALQGDCTVGTAKNAVLPILAATMLTQEPVLIKKAPDILDVESMCQLIGCYNGKIDRARDGLRIENASPKLKSDPYSHVRKLRASFLLAGPMLARTGQVSIALPGGCEIGHRPVDLHVKGLQAMGARMQQEGGIINLRARALKGCEIHLDFPSVGATENLMMAACLAHGETVLHHAANEPEIVDLARFLRRMGAHIRGAGTDTIYVEGVKQLHGVEYTPMFDRVEAGTFMLAAAITGGDVLIRHCIPEMMTALMSKLEESGVMIQAQRDCVRVRGRGKLMPADIKTLPHPGFPTDLQAPAMALMCLARGTSVISETVFENRYLHVSELNRMGANIRVEDKIAIVEGPVRFTGTSVMACDLRGGAALILAGLAAEGISHISGIQHIDRGYDHLEDKLRSLGGRIVRTADSAPDGSQMEDCG